MTIIAILGIQVSAVPQPTPAVSHQATQEMTLADLSPGKTATVTGCSNRISPDRRAQLQSYGVIPGHPLSVVQHTPVTIIQVENIELALERDLARLVWVKI